MCLFSYRSTEQSSIKYSPFQMMFGREPILPIDTEVLLPAKSLECEEITDKVVSDAMDSLQTFQKQMYSKAEGNILKAQKKQKESYDSRHAAQTFSVGEKVLKENTAQKQRKGGKLADKWLGPYRINREISKGVYALEGIRDGNVLKNSCNMSRLKRYYGEVNVCQETEESGELVTEKLINNSQADTSLAKSIEVPKSIAAELSHGKVGKDSFQTCKQLILVTVL